MINAETLLFNTISQALTALYTINSTNISFQKTRKEFEGDFTLVTFPFTKESKRSPEQLGNDLGAFLQKNNDAVEKFNVVKGFLNISLSDKFWLTYFNATADDATPGIR